MPVPTSINDLSTNAASNSPNGAVDAPSSLDDHIRAHGAFIAQLRDGAYNGADAVKLTGDQTIAGTKTFSSAIAGSITGNAATATTATQANKLTTARTIGGVSFDGSANINLPGVNQAGNQNTTGNAATATVAANAIGEGQTWQDMLASRAVDTAYQNTTGRTISVYINLRANASGRQVQVSPDGLAWLPLHNWSGFDTSTGCSFSVPASWYYRTVGTVAGINQWMELR